MNHPTAGYDGPSPDTTEKKDPNPSDQDWRFEQAAFMPESHVTVRILLDGEPIGMVRLPTLEHLRFLRERIQES